MISPKFKQSILIFLLQVLCITIYGQSLEVNWKFYTGSKVGATPLIDDNVLYIGAENGTFYAIDLVDGKEKWTFYTHGYILGKATVNENTIFFESSNVFYALDKKGGQELWSYNLEWPIWGYKIDHWDDIRSCAIVYKDVFYTGTSLGSLIGLNTSSGDIVFRIDKGINSPIRTTPVIDGDRIYFGDWQGMVYCHSLSTQKLIWKKKTYNKRYYDTFGSITSELLVYKGNLYFGARNPQITVLNAMSGEPEWVKNENDSTGGWIIGSPVVEDNTLYMGGSDNFQMMAMDPENGDLKWSYLCGLNIYTKAVILNNEIIFTAGSAYWYFEKMSEEDKMLGGLFIVDKENGKLIEKMLFPEPIFSSPVVKDNIIYFGSYDGNIYAVEYKK